jgi:hypothetical protein
LFPGITDNAHARARARTIAGWKPLPVTPRPVTALAPRQGSLERLPLLADHSAASAARIIPARFAFVSGARASRLVILGRYGVPLWLSAGATVPAKRAALPVGYCFWMSWTSRASARYLARCRCPRREHRQFDTVDRG